MAKKSVKEKQIAYIKKVTKEWGEITSGELRLDHSPCVNSLGDGGICELAECFNSDGVITTIYDRDGNEIDWWDYKYEDLSEDLIDQIWNIIEQYEVENLKTEKRCQ
jgi:hypothetical protein